MGVLMDMDLELNLRKWFDDHFLAILGAIVVGVIGLVVLWLVGYPILVSLVLLILFGVAVWKALGNLVTAAFLALLLIVLYGPLKDLTAVWFAGETHTKLFAFLREASFINLTLLLFLALWLLTYAVAIVTDILSSIRLVRIRQDFSKYE